MEKEYYFQKAEEIIKKAGLSDLLSVNRTAFGRLADDRIKVFLQPINRKQYEVRWKEAMKKLPDLGEEKWALGFDGEKITPFYIHGYLFLDIKNKKEDSVIDCK